MLAAAVRTFEFGVWLPLDSGLGFYCSGASCFCRSPVAFAFGNDAVAAAVVVERVEMSEMRDVEGDCVSLMRKRFLCSALCYVRFAFAFGQV